MKRIILLMLILIFAFNMQAFSEDKNISGKIGVGAYLQGDNEAKERAGEYKEDQSSMSGNVDIKAYNSDSHLYFKGNYLSESENEFNLNANLLRHIDLKVDYNRLYHRKDMDTLFIEYDKNNFNPKVALGLIPFENEPDGKVYGVNKFVSDDTSLSPGGQWYGFEQEDMSLFDKDYFLRRTETKGTMTFSIPNLENMKLFFKGRVENRKGYEHKTVMVGKCTVCHVRGLRKDIDETTRDLTGGFRVTLGPVYFSYSHMYREFYTDGGTLTTKFDSVEGLRGTKPDKYIIFSPRLNSETYGTVEEVSKTPESRKNLDTLKLRIDLPYYTTLSSSYTHSEITNNDSYGEERGEDDNIELEQDAFNLRLTTHLLNRKLTLTGKFRYVELDRDSVHATLEKDDAFYFQPNYPAPVNYNGNDFTFDMTKTYYDTATNQPIIFDVEGDSTYDREQYLIGFDAVYRMFKNKLKIRLGYEYENIDRDNYYVYPHDTETERNTFKAGLDFKPFKNFSGRFKFSYSDIDNPFAKTEAGCIEYTLTNDPILHYGGDPTANKAAYPLVYDRRYYTGSASPSEIYNYSLNLNWMPMNKVSLSFIGKYTDSENDEGNTDWDYDGYMLGFDGTIMLSEKFVFSFGYSYEKMETESLLSVGMYAG